MTVKRMKPKLFIKDIIDSSIFPLYGVLSLYYAIENNMSQYYLIYRWLFLIIISVLEMIHLYKLYAYSTVVIGTESITITRRSKKIMYKKGKISGIWSNEAYGPYEVRTTTIPYKKIANYGIYAARIRTKIYTKELVEYYPWRLFSYAYIELWFEDLEGNKCGFDLFNYSRKQIMEIINRLERTTGIISCKQHDLNSIMWGHFPEDEEERQLHKELWRRIGQKLKVK